MYNILCAENSLSGGQNCDAPAFFSLSSLTEDGFKKAETWGGVTVAVFIYSRQGFGLWKCFNGFMVAAAATAAAADDIVVVSITFCTAAATTTVAAASAAAAFLCCLGCCLLTVTLKMMMMRRRRRRRT